jgi:hypothetical protein
MFDSLNISVLRNKILLFCRQKTSTLPNKISLFDITNTYDIIRLKTANVWFDKHLSFKKQSLLFCRQMTSKLLNKISLLYKTKSYCIIRHKPHVVTD